MTNQVTPHVIIITFESGLIHVYPDDITTFHFVIANHDHITNIQRRVFRPKPTGEHNEQR